MQGCQEGVRKDTERAFGVLQARFHILKIPMQSLSMENITNIVMACVVLHNIILEDESGLGLDLWDSGSREGDNRRCWIGIGIYKQHRR
jgi:hypothetical protein